MTNKNIEQNEELLKNQEELREREQRTAGKIQVVLEEEKMALQPFMFFSEFGVAARVRLVDTKDIVNDKTNSQGDVAEGGEPDGAPKSEQS